MPRAQARDARVDGHPGSHRIRALRPRPRSPGRRSRGPARTGTSPSRPEWATGPVLWANRWRSLPQIPPVVTATRAQAATGQLGLGKIDQRRGKGGVGHVELNGAHPASVGAFRPVGPGRDGGAGRPRRLGCAAVRVPDANLDEVRDRRVLPRRGLPGPRRVASRPAGPVAALPEARGVLRRSGPAIPSTPGTSSAASRSSPTGPGISTAWPSTRTWSMPPSAISGRPTSICTRSSCGPSTGEPPTTTSPSTATTAATAWWSPAPTAATSS